MSQLSNSILESIQIISKHQIEKAEFDKTIQAEILNCIDKNIGYYRCNYKGAIINAYSSNLDIIYQKGNFVHILIPQNDTSKNKVILGLAGIGATSSASLPISNSLSVTVDEQEKDLKFSYKGISINQVDLN